MAALLNSALFSEQQLALYVRLVYASARDELRVGACRLLPPAADALDSCAAPVVQAMTRAAVHFELRVGACCLLHAVHTAKPGLPWLKYGWHSFCHSLAAKPAATAAAQLAACTAATAVALPCWCGNCSSRQAPVGTCRGALQAHKEVAKHG